LKHAILIGVVVETLLVVGIVMTFYTVNLASETPQVQTISGGVCFGGCTVGLLSVVGPYYLVGVVFLVASSIGMLVILLQLAKRPPAQGQNHQPK